MKRLTHERLLELLNYDPDTGVFTWRVFTSSRTAAGSVAGTIKQDGYISIKIEGELFRANRLAWFYMTKKWPSFLIDHANTLRSDNSWVNLREASKSDNGFNRGPQRNNSVGFKGVYQRKDNGKFSATIWKSGKKMPLGCFDTPEEASDAYAKAANMVAGDFARVS